MEGLWNNPSKILLDRLKNRSNSKFPIIISSVNLCKQNADEDFHDQMNISLNMSSSVMNQHFTKVEQSTLTICAPRNILGISDPEIPMKVVQLQWDSKKLIVTWVIHRRKVYRPFLLGKATTTSCFLTRQYNNVSFLNCRWTWELNFAKRWCSASLA